MHPIVRSGLLTLAIFLGFLIAWKWPLIEALLRPPLVEIGVVSSPVVEELPKPGFHYPRLGISAPLTESPLTSPLEFRDWREISAVLRDGVSLSYPGEEFSATPLAFVTGHSSDVTNHPYAAIFAGLGQAELGDEFLLLLDEATERYTVVETKVLDPRNTRGFENLTPQSGQRVALVTCWPPLTTRQRMVVVGELVSQ